MSENYTTNEKNFNSAIDFLKSLPRREDKTHVGLREKSPSQIIADNVAQTFTNNFRQALPNNITIPISWTFDKQALLNLLGITDHVGYPEVDGVRFYAGVNDNNQLTLVAVSTTPCTAPGCGNCSDDLTIDDNYPYYDYADPCPNNCSNTGSLSIGQNNNPITFTKVS